jgi:hypothetical protein
MNKITFAIGCALFTALCFSPTSTQAAAPEAWRLGAPIVSYWAGPMPMTDAVARQMAEGGFNLAWVSKRGLPKGGDIVDFYRKQLDILQKHGLRGILAVGGVKRDPKAPTLLDDPQLKAELDATLKGVGRHPALYAYHIIDEPNVALFPNIARIKDYLKEKDPSTLVYVNLLPMYATHKQLGTSGDPVHAYQEYLKQYVKVVKPDLLSFDIYPFGVNGDRSDYFLNLSLVRQAALEAHIPFMVIQQAAAWHKNQPIPTGEMLRWQAYTALAYGSHGLSWYVYSYPGHDGGMSFSDGTYRERLIGKEKGDVVLGGTPTPLYYYAAVLHKEYIALAAELQPLKSIAVYHSGMAPDGTVPLPKDAPFRIEPPVPAKNYAPPAPVEGYVTGYFGEGTVATHALVVNLDYRTYSGRGEERRNEFIFNPVRRHLVGPGPLQVFDAATSKWTDAPKDGVDLHLAPGDCLLVRMAR